MSIAPPASDLTLTPAPAPAGVPDWVTQVAMELAYLPADKVSALLNLVKAENRFADCKRHWCTGGHCTMNCEQK